MRRELNNDNEINLQEIRKLVFDSNVSGYEIEKFNGTGRSLISKVRNGKIPLENVSLRTLMRWQQFIDHHKKQ